MQTHQDWAGNTPQGVRVGEFKYHQVSLVQIPIKHGSWDTQKGDDGDAMPCGNLKSLLAPIPGLQGILDQM